METETSPKLVEDVLTPEITSPLSMNLEPISFSASTFPSELPSHFQNDLSNDWEAHATSLPLPSSAPTSIESTHGFASTSFSNLPSTHENNPFNPWFVPADQVGDSSPPFAPPSTTSPMFPSMNALNPTEPWK
ncbi:hypothetical protein HMI55_002951 [Coelomomyces lativittatus]|nr:hypothetical protein HMI55_002951 [Coelomomyces lativittatus]